jgi:hypothetical protein
MRSLNLPVERRVDGDRVTELWPARDWQNRKDANQFQHDQRGIYPPALPRHAPRDHLHDRNREHCLLDPANPGVDQYVRVTRRRMPTVNQETEAMKQNQARLRTWQRREDMEASEANELLELRSMGIRSTMAAGSQALLDHCSGFARPKGSPDTPHPSAMPNARVAQLEKRVMGSTAERAPPPPGGGTGPTTRSMTMQEAKMATMRGGWPTK